MWRSSVRLLTQFDRTKLEPAIALRNAIGVALPLAAGVAMGMPLGGLAVASGALQVAYADGHDPYSRRGFRMLASTLLCALAVVIGGLSGRNFLFAVIAVVVWSFIAGIIVVLGPDAETLGVISLVTLIIYAAQALTVDRALNAGLLALGGGLLQTGLSVAVWPLARREPERRALARLYSELASSALAEMKSKEAPLAASAGTQAQDALGRLGRDHGTEAQRLWSLLNQAERIRLSILTLGRLRNRIARQSGQSSEIEVFGKFLALAAEVLLDIANTLVTHRNSVKGRNALLLFQQLAENYRKQESTVEPPFLAAVRRSLRHQLDAVAGQLRSALQITANQGLAEAATTLYEAMPNWRSRINEDLSKLFANFTLQSPAYRHAIRLATALAVGEIVAHAISARRSYWLPMTISLVLKPEFTVTFSRGLLRIAGTVAGLVLSTGLFHFLPPSIAVEVILVAIFVFLVRWIGPANYGVFAINVSALVVLMIAFTGVSPREVILTRGLMTTLGGIMALAAYALWPTWEIGRTPDILAKMLDAYREYFRAVAERYFETGNAGLTDLNRGRLEARRARSSVEASVDRLRLEPVANSADITALSAMLASSHRFINAAMAMEGAHEKAAPREVRSMKTFASHIDLTLGLLASALRGQNASARDLPDLREDHHALVTAIGAGHDALLADETDRLTNSLNTLREQIFAWRARTSAVEARRPEPQPV